jgi:hypothetical protein
MLDAVEEGLMATSNPLFIFSLSQDSAHPMGLLKKI